jgi:hypothetical protein
MTTTATENVGAVADDRAVPASRSGRRARWALLLGMLALMAGIAFVLSGSPAVLARANGVEPEEGLASIRSRASVCQASESLPRDTTAIVAWLGASTGPSVAAEVLAGGRVLARGEHASGWSGRSVTIPVKAIGPVSSATICLSFTSAHETVYPRGAASAPASAATWNGRALPGRFTVEYLTRGGRSWWSRASATIEHMGLGRSPTGTWAAIAALILMVAISVTASGLLLRELR